MGKRFLALGLVMLGNGCQFARIEAAGSTVPIYLTRPAQQQQYDVVGHFRIENSDWRWSGSSWTPAINQLIEKEVHAKGGEAAINVAITGDSGAADQFLSCLTLDIGLRTTTEIEGDVIKFK